MKTACVGCPMLNDYERCTAAGNRKLRDVLECPHARIRRAIEKGDHNDSKKILKSGAGN